MGIFGDLAQNIIDFFAMWLVKGIEAILWAELWMVKGLVLYTPALWDPWFETPYVTMIPGISGSDGIVGAFYARCVGVLGILVALGILLSGVMLMAGWLPKWQQAAKENLSRVLGYSVMALAAPKLLQLVIDLNGLMMHLAFDSPEQYDALLDGLRDSLFSFQVEGSFARLIGFSVAVIAVLFVALELVLRYGFVLGLGIISPLIVLSLAFNATRGFGLKALKTFAGWTFFQFLAAVMLRVGLEATVAFSNAGASYGWVNSVPTWALLAGFFLATAALPKILAGVGDSVHAAAAPARAAKMAIAAGTGVAVGASAAVAGKGVAAAATNRAASNAARGRDYGRALKVANLGRGIEERGTNLRRSASRSLLGQTKHSFGASGMTPHGYDDLTTKRQPWHQRPPPEAPPSPPGPPAPGHPRRAGEAYDANVPPGYYDPRDEIGQIAAQGIDHENRERTKGKAIRRLDDRDAARFTKRLARETQQRYPRDVRREWKKQDPEAYRQAMREQRRESVTRAGRQAVGTAREGLTKAGVLERPAKTPDGPKGPHRRSQETDENERSNDGSRSSWDAVKSKDGRLDRL